MTGETWSKTLAQTECDAVIIGTPIDLNRVITINQPSTRVTYELQERGKPDLEDVVDQFLDRKPLMENALNLHHVIE